MKENIEQQSILHKIYHIHLEVASRIKKSKPENVAQLTLSTKCDGYFFLEYPHLGQTPSSLSATPHSGQQSMSRSATILYITLIYAQMMVPVNNGRRNIYLNLKYLKRTGVHDAFQGFHAADKRTGPCYSGLAHHKLTTGGGRYQTVGNRLYIARDQCAFNPDRLETPRIYTPATRNGSLDADRQCICPIGNVQLAVSRRNAVFVSLADFAVLFHAGCLDCLDWNCTGLGRTHPPA